METDPSLQEETSETRRRSLVTDFFALLDPAGKKMLRRSGQGEGRGGVVSPIRGVSPCLRGPEMYHLAKACGFQDGREEPWTQPAGGWRL